MKHSLTEQRLLRLAERSTIRIVDFDPKFRDAVIDSAKQMHRSSIYSGMKLDEELLIKQLSLCGNIVKDRMFKIAVRGDELLGGFYGYCHSTFFSTDLMANDLIWWVNPSARGGAAALMLIAEFERWAKERGAVQVMVGQSTATEIARTTKLFEHCGYRVVGFNTVKEL